MAKYRNLEVGDPCPPFRQRSTSSDAFNFDTVAGRYVVLCFFASAADEIGRNMLRIVEENRALFDDTRIAFFGVSLDPNDRAEARVQASMPGVRYFWDFDGGIARLYGVIPADATDGQVAVRRYWLVLDPTLHVLAVFQAEPDGQERRRVAEFLAALPPVDRFCGFPLPTPIIILPNVFEADLCDRLIELYRADGGADSGFMRDENGRTVPVTDYDHKRRRDAVIEDEQLLARIRNRVHRRVVPEIRKVHQFEVTRMERYIVGCYEAATGGHFKPHRDNTTKGTAHRRFALSINLNDDFEGGEIAFPEYGPRTYKPPVGGAVVFSCSLLHTVVPIVRGTRYAFLPFLYDDAAAAIRETNNPYLDERVGEYRNAPGSR